MNYEATWKQMAEAAAAAAKGHWTALRGFAVEELKRLAQAGVDLEKDFLTELAEARQLQDASERAEAERVARRRMELGFKSLRRASEGVFVAAKGDAKLAAEAAYNAAVGVLRSAINTSIGIPLL